MKRIKASLQHHKSSTDTSLIEIPDELIEVILSKCPVKSVVRFKSVSRSWHSIISTPRFSRTLRTKSLENQNKFFIFTRENAGETTGLLLLHLIKSENDVEFRTESMLSYPGLSDCVPRMPLCSCDGLMLLPGNPQDIKGKECILWNPFIGKYITIPAPIFSFSKDYHIYHDSITDDYKIISFAGVREYMVYSCKEGSWGEIEGYPSVLEHVSSIIFKSRVSVDGCFYLMRKDEIVWFDFRDGKLHEFRQPDDVKALLRVNLVVVSGRLCLYGYTDCYDHKLQLWVFEKKGGFEHSWKKLISMEKAEPNMESPRPVCLTSEDDVVLSAYGDVTFDHFMYTRSDCTFRVIYLVPWNYSTLYLPYRENLYLTSSNNKC